MHPPLNANTRSIARVSAVVIILAFHCFCPIDRAFGDMTLTLSGQPGSPLVVFSLTGTSTATSSFNGPFTGQMFDVYDGSDLFPPEITNANSPFGIYALASGGGTVLNLTAGTSNAVTGVTLQDTQLFGVARFGVGFSGSQTVAIGDSLAWSGSGTIDLSTSNLTFNDITKGSLTGIAEGSGFRGTLIIVPEPGTSMSLIHFGIGLLAIRRRAINKKLA